MAGQPVWRALAAGLLVALAAALAGCASSEVTRTASAPRFPPWEGPVEVLPRLPDSGYVLLGTIIARGGSAADADDLLDQILDDAADSGASAVVLQGKMRSRSNPSGTVVEQAAWILRKR